MHLNDIEIIDLASEGWFYPKDHPFSSGRATIRHLNFNIEKILCNGNLKKRGELEKEFIRSVVVEPVDFNTILNCDFETILLNSRILNYGKSAKYKIHCPHCDLESQQEVSFLFKGKTPLKPICVGTNKIEILLSENKKINLKIPTISESRSNGDLGWLSFLKHITVECSSQNIEDFIYNELTVSESKYLREIYKTQFPGFDTKIKLNCSCGQEFETMVDVNLDIFGYTPEYRKSVQEEMFDLCYHSNGAFTMDGVQAMPVLDRIFYVNRLVETKNKEKEAEQKAMKNNGSSKTVSPPPRVK